jgi:hypothetical protein
MSARQSAPRLVDLAQRSSYLGPVTEVEVRDYFVSLDHSFV